jgi:hypothetical protein
MQIDVDVPQIKSNTMNSQTNWWIECCIACNLGYIPIKNIVISLITDASGVHPKKNGWTTYSLKVRQIIANIAGFRTNTEIHENRKAKRLPNDSSIYEYSAPDFVINVPNSA